ncbi:hypothetical protein Ptr902_09457 [Pyrenophora tritici-repentis]|nr:hypothetical protein Ptr902_09457 [Pyrenophora tritici-repentis]
MDSMQPSFGDAFESMLPNELKQAIFKLAAADNSNEINISLSEDDEASLQAPAIDFLLKLKQEYPATMYSHALSFLTGPTMRWVLKSEWEPHRRVLAAFRAKAPLDIRQSIKHLYMPKVTIRGVIDPSTLANKKEDLKFVTLPDGEDYSPYLDSLHKEGLHGNNAGRLIMKDLQGTIMLIPYVFPCLEKFDFSLDMFDCLPPAISHHPLTDSVSRLLRHEIAFNMSLIMIMLTSLRSLRNVNNVDIRIFWGDFFRRNRRFDYSVSKEDEDKLEILFSRELIKHAPAKSITSYAKQQGIYVMGDKVTA